MLTVVDKQSLLFEKVTMISVRAYASLLHLEPASEDLMNAAFCFSAYSQLFSMVDMLLNPLHR
jgi:hypothetical protein